MRTAIQTERWLRTALIVIGAVFVAGVYPLMLLWPAGFAWRPEQHEYEQMIAVIYVVLGVFLLRASRAPLDHLPVIWFAVWSSLAHAAVMTLHVAMSPGEWVHLVGDIPALVIIAAVLAVLTRRRVAATD
jgi:membrane protein DedA with SNARE-associated domain